MKVIATINFKGGVGKTTISWLLAKHAAERVGNWYENQHKRHGKTLLDAIDSYERCASGNAAHFDFSIGSSFIYEVTPDLHFVPSVTDLYWLELEVFRPEHIKGFANALLGKIQRSKFQYDVVFFDCPPSFTLLSYSILSNCSLVLIPVNPDVFASTGLE